jgi:hypothetical protein
VLAVIASGTPTARERAFALPAAIVFGVVAMLLILGTAAYTMGRLDDHDRRRDRVVAMPVVDSAVTRIKYGLERNLFPEEQDYRPTPAQLADMLDGSSATLLAGSIISPAIPPGMPNYTIREPQGGGMAGYWQLIRVFAPEYTDSTDDGVVIIYLRAWSGSATNPAAGSEPRLVRVELRPGRFADYQAVIDGPIVFGPGARLNGPIHTNGFGDERANMLPDLKGVNDRVSTTGTTNVSCSGAAQITTAEGSVETSDFPGCPVAENTGRYVNLLAAEEAFERMRIACGGGSARVRCFNNPREGSSVPASIAQRAPDLRGYRVRLSPGSIHVTGYEIDFVAEQPIDQAIGATQTIATPPGSTTVLFFADNVIVSGNTNARVTIAARKPGGGGGNVTSGAANIYLAGNTTHSGAGSVLGLMAQGGVVLDAVKQGGGYACIDRIRAGIVAMSGTMTIDPRYTTKLYQAGGPSCGRIQIQGSLAAHRSPVLVWKWDNRPQHVGYSSRDYSWSESLRRNPPPYFPTTDTWESRHVRPANLDCFSNGDITDQDC